MGYPWLGRGLRSSGAAGDSEIMPGVESPADPGSSEGGYKGGMMSESFGEVYLARHGETAWTLSHQHTGRTDIPLTERGERNAQSLGHRLRGMSFTQVLVSPMQRAKRTCELAGFGDRAEVDLGRLEWDY